MKLAKYRLWAILSLIPGVTTVFFCWYLTWIGILLSLCGIVIYFSLRKPYQEDPFNFQPSYQLAKMGIVFNVMGLFLSLVFTLLQTRA